MKVDVTVETSETCIQGQERNIYTSIASHDRGHEGTIVFFMLTTVRNDIEVQTSAIS